MSGGHCCEGFGNSHIGFSGSKLNDQLAGGGIYKAVGEQDLVDSASGRNRQKQPPVPYQLY